MKNSDDLTPSDLTPQELARQYYQRDTSIVSVFEQENIAGDLDAIHPSFMVFGALFLILIAILWMSTGGMPIPT